MTTAMSSTRDRRAVPGSRRAGHTTPAALPFAHPGLHTAESVLTLQRTAGNAATAALLEGRPTLAVQRKLSPSKRAAAAQRGHIEMKKLMDDAETAGVDTRSADPASLGNRLETVRLEFLDEWFKPSDDDGRLETLQHRQHLLTKEVAKHKSLQPPSGATKTGHWFKKTGKGLLSTTIGLGKAALKAIFGPLFRTVMLIVSGKERKQFVGDLRKYIDVMRKHGSLRGSDNIAVNAIYGAIGFMANTFLTEVAGLAGWLMFMTGLIGLIPGAQAALGLAGIFGSIATLAALSKAGLNGILAVWSGIRVLLQYRQLPDAFDDDASRKRRDHYLASLSEFGGNIKNTVSGARDVGVVALTGGLGAATQGKNFTEGVGGKLEGYYKPAFDGGAYAGQVGNVHDKWTSSDPKYQGWNQADVKKDLIKHGQIGVTGKGQMKDDVIAAGAVEGVDKSGKSSDAPILSKKDLPKVSATVRTAVLEGIGPVTRIVATAKHLWQGILLIKKGVAWIVNKVKGLFRSTQETVDLAMIDVEDSVGGIEAMGDTTDGLRDLVSSGD